MEINKAKLLLISTCYSLFVSLEVICLSNLFYTTGRTVREMYSYMYDFYKCASMIAFMLCAGTFYFNIKLFKNSAESRIKGIIIELLMIAITFIPLYLGWSYFLK